MLDLVRGAALLVALVTTGVMAGVFQLYSHTVMPGLARADDRTFVKAFQVMDRAIINPLFLCTFLGPFAFTVLAALLSLGADTRAALPWLLVALALYLAVLVVTGRVNVPMNNAIKAAGEPDEIADIAAVRQRFDEARWTRWNHVRSVATTAAFVCLAWAVVLYGRSI